MSRDRPVILSGTRVTRGRRPRLAWRWRSREYWMRAPGYRWAMTWTPWAGYMVTSWARIVGGVLDSFGYFDWSAYNMRKVDLSKSTSGSRPVHLAAVESDLLGRCPQIIAHLTHVSYDDGSPRQVGTITLRTRGTVWSAEARDPDAAARMVATAQSLDDALALLDLLLGADEAPWEPDIYLQERRKESKKK